MRNDGVIIGECVGAGAPARVAISRLGAVGCEVRTLADAAMPDGDLALWIGAIGPLPIVARRGRRGGVAARFKQPLEPAILAHFAV